MRFLHSAIAQDIKMTYGTHDSNRYRMSCYRIRMEYKLTGWYTHIRRESAGEKL